MKNEAAQPIVEVRNLKEYFNINMGMFRTKPLKAVDNVSFAIQPGETLGLVGESGCGKTTVGRTILHLYKPTGGEVLYKGRKIQTKADIQAFRNKASMVFQDPYSSLNPRMTVADIIGEPLDVHKLYSSRQERQERILELMGYVGLNSEHAARYAHEFSGGQDVYKRQPLYRVSSHPQRPSRPGRALFLRGRSSMPSPTRGRWHGGAVTDEVD